MQRTEILTQNQVIELIEFILSDSKNELYESYSDMEKEIIRFSNSTEFDDYFLKGIIDSIQPTSHKLKIMMRGKCFFVGTIMEYPVGVS
ncbi:MAG: hypothetical protein LBJ04_04005 [Sphingobacterium sp.]|jgi:hypothetical protein|nr:hypothetical protein [Sphingobacterium sp.]